MFPSLYSIDDSSSESKSEDLQFSETSSDRFEVEDLSLDNSSSDSSLLEDAPLEEPVLGVVGLTRGRIKVLFL